MAMVRITNGKIISTVSRETYENKFRKNGWHELKETKNKGKKITREEYGEEQPGQQEELDIDTIPISDMNNDQLKEFAKRHNIDTSGASTVSEARKIIQNAVRKKNM